MTQEIAIALMIISSAGEDGTPFEQAVAAVVLHQQIRIAQIEESLTAMEELLESQGACMRRMIGRLRMKGYAINWRNLILFNITGLGVGAMAGYLKPPLWICCLGGFGLGCITNHFVPPFQKVCREIKGQPELVDDPGDNTPADMGWCVAVAAFVAVAIIVWYLM